MQEQAPLSSPPRPLQRLLAGTALVLALSTAQVGCSADGGADPSPPDAATAAPQDPEVVAVDWLGRGALYAATVRERRGELTRVDYANGEVEWVEASRILPWPDLVEQTVMVWTPRGASEGKVIEVRGFLVHLRFEDGAHTWFGRNQLYALQGAPPEVGRTETMPSFPRRRGVDPSQLRPGAKVLAYWLNAGEVMAERPWTAEVLSVDGERVQLRYLYDATLGTVSAKHVLHVFEGVANAPPGTRVWVPGTASVGTLGERMGDDYLVTTSEGEQRLPADQLVGVAPPVSPERLTPGTHMTVLWAGHTLYHGTVVSLEGDQVIVAWHDGSDASPVPIADVVDIWEAAAR